MKLTIKTLQQITFKVDIEPERTVRQLKDKIESEQGKEYQVASQKLIYSGKILADDTPLSDYEIDEKKFIVLMITRPPPAPKPAEPAAAAAPKAAHSKPAGKQDESKRAPASVPAPVDADKSALRRPTTRSSTSGPAPPTPAPAAAPSNTSTTTTTTSTPHVLAQQAPGTTTPTTNTNTTAAARQPSRAPLPSDGLNQSQQMMHRLAAFMNQPEFRQMQDLIQQSPHLLSSTIEALAGSNPEIYNLITENPDVFVAALNHPPTGGSMQTHSGASRGGMGVMGGGGGGASSELLAGPGPAIEQILPGVSEHDKEAIERLKELGFSEYLAVQAYMACDKDEQLAANLLFQMEQ